MAQDRSSAGKPESARLPLMGAYSNRDASASKDQRFVNIFPETRKVEQIENTKIFLNKRPGLSVYRDYGTGEGRGCIYFDSKFYVAVGNKVYEDAVSPVEKITLTGSTGPLSMILGNSSTLGDYLFICDGTYGWIIETDGTATQITDTGIYSIDISNGGAGYGTVPLVSVDIGSDVETDVTVVDGVVTAITINVQGTGYTTASVVTIAAPKTEFATQNVDTTNDWIPIGDIFYATANAVVYSNEGGTNIGGLVHGTTYYIVLVAGDATKIRLATSEANANAGTYINITSQGTGAIHALTGTITATATLTLNSFPTPHNISSVFIDGYVVLSKGSDVYTCDLDEPTKWSSNNFLSAEMFPDPVKALSRQNNQVAVFGGNSIEFFYDAANVSGSPLSRNDSTTIQMGTCAPQCVIGNERYMFYLSQSDSGGRAAWIVEGFQPKKVSDEYIERILDAETNMDQVHGFSIRTKGHQFYIINLKTQGRTLVYDPEEKLWHEWSTNTASVHGVFTYDHAADNGTGYAYLLHTSNGTLYKLDPMVYNDGDTNILVELVTNRYDMDTYYRKFMSSIKVVGDRYASTNDISFSWTDTDYQSWSNTKTISMSDDYPAFHRLGSFRRRAFRIQHSSNNPLRLESLECVYVKGTS